jgi:hypothetical protein
MMISSLSYKAQPRGRQKWNRHARCLAVLGRPQEGKLPQKTSSVSLLKKPQKTSASQGLAWIGLQCYSTHELRNEM